MRRRNSLLAGTVIPVVIGFGVAAGSGQGSAGLPEGENPTAVPRPYDAGAFQSAACNPCGPCGPCNPCAAACGPCGPCNPCAAACGPCEPCNPCAAGAAAGSECVVPRLVSACNPCAAANPCNPCGVCNPCAAANPCNPCGACNPCAAANPCNPCGACNPCAAANPCGPCGADEVALTDDEARDAYACVQAAMTEGYAKSGHRWAMAYPSWKNHAARPYVSDTHGARFVNNYANERGAANYGLFEDAGPAPEGTVLAKDSFTVKGGRVAAGPLFLMEKMAAGFDANTRDWRYTLILPSGKVVGSTGGAGAGKVAFCAECHLSVEEQDSRFFLDEAYRAE